MSRDALSAAAQPLLDALHELLAAYQGAQECADALLDALASSDAGAVERAVIAHSSALRAVNSAEERRRTAERALASTLASPSPSGLAPGHVTVTALLAILPPAEAEQLRALRHDLLSTLVRLQATQRQATALLRGAQTVMRRSLRARGITQTIGYGPRGEQRMAPAGMQGRVARRA